MSEKVLRQLLLMRHAKSSWNQANMTDHERPLAPRGKKAAPEMAEWLETNDYVPELILCSTARRAFETAELVASNLKKSITIEFLDVLYHAPPATLKATACQAPADVCRLMIVAHNPGMHELLNEFTLKETGFPTAAIACLETESNSWQQFFASKPHLKFFITPKELDY